MKQIKGFDEESDLSAHQLKKFLGKWKEILKEDGLAPLPKKKKVRRKK